MSRPSMLMEGTTFAQLRNQHGTRAPAHWFLKPVAVELEITTVCNMKCGGCAIIEDVEAAHPGPTADELLRVLQESHAVGAYAYSVTGGEPFTRMDALCTLLEHAPMDLFKIQTNGKMFTSPLRTRALLQRLKDAGFGSRHRHIKPSIHLSMGMQTEEGVPLENVVHFTRLFQQMFQDTANFALNILADTEAKAWVHLSNLERLYMEMHGVRFPGEQALFVHLLSMDHTPRLVQLGRWSGRHKTLRDRVEELPAGYVCFNFSQEENTPVPRVLVRADGSLYPCSCFGHAGLQGNIHQEPMRVLLERANQDEGLRTVHDHGLLGLLEKSETERPGAGDARLPKDTSICKVCKVLREPDEPVHVPLPARLKDSA